MTPDQIDQLPGGRELDEAVHVHIFGLPLTDIASPAYSITGDGMLAVLERMRERRFDYTLLNCRYANEPIARQICTFYWDKPNQRYRQFDGRGNSAPEAVCRAALKAVLSTPIAPATEDAR